MKPFARNVRSIMPALLALVAMRALVPLGYMPAAPGSGLLFEVCHEGMPLVMSPASRGAGAHDNHHHHHNQSGVGGDHDRGHDAAAEGCALGHILGVAFLDSVASVDVFDAAVGAFDPPEPATPSVPRLRLAHAPRGPPVA